MVARSTAQADPSPRYTVHLQGQQTTEKQHRLWLHPRCLSIAVVSQPSSALSNRKASETRRTARGTRRKARGARRDGKRASQAEQQQNVNSAGTSLLTAERSEGLITAVLDSAFWMNDAPRSIKELPFSCFPKPERRLQDCTAWIGTCGRPHDQGPVSWRPTTAK